MKAIVALIVVILISISCSNKTDQRKRTISLTIQKNTTQSFNKAKPTLTAFNDIKCIGVLATYPETSLNFCENTAGIRILHPHEKAGMAPFTTGITTLEMSVKPNDGILFHLIGWNSEITGNPCIDVNLNMDPYDDYLSSAYLLSTTPANVTHETKSVNLIMSNIPAKYKELGHCGGPLFDWGEETQAFDPDSVSSGTLNLWLDASDVTTLYNDETCTSPATDGQNVLCWEDKSSLTINATNIITTAPTFNEVGINGKESLYFNSAQGDCLKTYLGVKASMSFFAVYRPTTLVGGSIVGARYSGDQTRIYEYLNSSYYMGGVGGNNFISVAAPTLNTSTNYLASLLHESAGDTNLNLNRTNSNTLGSTIINTPILDKWIYIGCNNDAMSGNMIENPINGQIAEVLIYDGKLSPTDKDAVENYLTAKWNILAI